MRLHGTTYFGTHTVHDRRFLRPPSPEVNHIVLYAVARAAKLLNVELRWLVVLSNHISLTAAPRGN